MILIIDNYDSFTYNLVQLFNERGAQTKVVLNDKISVNEIIDLNPSGIILSPGPCTPKEAGICMAVVKALHKDFPLLGVCLGHQVIGEAFGSTVKQADKIMHGKLDSIEHDGHGLFHGITDAFEASRYHSLIIEKSSLATELMATAHAKSDGSIMAIAHKEYPVYGLQFHPESYATEHGRVMADNFIRIVEHHKEVDTCL